MSSYYGSLAPIGVHTMFSGQDTNGQSDPLGVEGRGIMVVGGTFDGAEVKIQLWHPGIEKWFDGPDLLFTEEESVICNFPLPTRIRADLSGAGASTSIDVGIM